MTGCVCAMTDIPVEPAECSSAGHRAVARAGPRRAWRPPGSRSACSREARHSSHFATVNSRQHVEGGISRERNSDRAGGKFLTIWYIRSTVATWPAACAYAMAGDVEIYGRSHLPKSV